MNKIRRKQLQEASELIAKAQGIIESVKDDEQEAHDNLPESIQYGEKGQQMEEYIDMVRAGRNFSWSGMGSASGMGAELHERKIPGGSNERRH